MGALTFFLGLQVKQKKDGIFISQDKYVGEILEKFSFFSIRSASTPMETHKALTKDKDGEDVDVMFILYRFQVQPKVSHLNAVKRIFRYLKGQPKLGLSYPKDSPLILEAFSDSDYAVLWIQNQMLDYGFNFMQINIHVDNESAICVVMNLVYHSKTKHIEIRHHFIRDSYDKRLIEIVKIHTDYNVADLLTKAFDVTRFQFLIARIGQTTATVETVNNGEQQLSVTVDGQTISITEASVRRHLQLADADGISYLPNTDIFEQLSLMRYVSNDDKLTFQKDEDFIKRLHDGGELATSSGPSSPRTSSEGSLGCHFTMGDIPVQARPERVSNLPNEPPLREGNTSRSGEGSMQLLELINLCTKLSDKVTSLEDELASTKAVYNKALITLTKRVKKLEKQLKHKRRRAVIDSSEDEGPSLDAEDSPKQGRMIEEIDKDETVNLVKSRELGKSHDTAEHRMESEHDDDDRTLAETLLNIKRSAAKGKAIMQESEPPKKIKKKEMIQISLDEEFAKSFYEEEQAQILQDEVYAKQVEAQWIADEERIPQEAKQTDEREKVINWNDPDVLRYHAVQNRPFSKAEDFIPKDSEIEKEVMKRPGFDLQQESSKKIGGSRKKTLARKRVGEKQSKEGAKKQKTEYKKEKEELKAYLDLVPREEFSMEIESLGTKYPIVDWKTHVLTENFMYYQIIKTDGGSKNYKIFSEMLDDFDRQDVMDLHRLVEERYATSRLEGYDLMLWGNLMILFQLDKEDEVWRHQHEYNLISWRLFDSCGIHILLMDNGIAIHMMIEKKYPLTQEMLSKMLSRKLEVDHENEMAFELLRFIRSQVQK
ncbi:hypothetical protein Tco_0397723 [Tanacetum coccineum]